MQRVALKIVTGVEPDSAPVNHERDDEAEQELEDAIAEITRLTRASNRRRLGAIALAAVVFLISLAAAGEDDVVLRAPLPEPATALPAAVAQPPPSKQVAVRKKGMKPKKRR